MITIVLEKPKYPHNVAAAIRAAACFGVDRVRWTGKRFEFEDGDRLPREERMKGYRSVDFRREDRPFAEFHSGTRVVGVEIMPTAAPLTHYHHWAWDAAYVFGPEDGGLSKGIRACCHEFVYIPAHHCLNLAAAVNVVLAHRAMQRQQHGIDQPVSPADTERRGLIEVAGWDGK